MQIYQKLDKTNIYDIIHNFSGKSWGFAPNFEIIVDRYKIGMGHHADENSVFLLRNIWFNNESINDIDYQIIFELSNYNGILCSHYYNDNKWNIVWFDKKFMNEFYKNNDLEP